jgi:hypothetical protein
VYYGKIRYDKKYLDTDILLVELYLFGERRGCTEFQNEVIDEVAAFLGEKDCEMTAEAIALLFNEATSNFKLRRFIADKSAWEGNALKVLQQSQDDTADIHSEYALAMYRAILERITTDAFFLAYSSCGPGIFHKDHIYRCGERGCGKIPDMALDGAGSQRLAGSGQAPYLKRSEFCSRYHIHSKEETCK